MLEVSDAAIIQFYAQLATIAADHSPVRNLNNSGWMADADFCFINVRATGLGDQPGTLLQATKLFPALRVNALHLGPYTDYDFGVIYAVRSTRTIAPIIVDATLDVSPETQLRALVSAAHLLGMTVGFDLEPHVAQFAIPVLLQPELFRWIMLAPDRHSLADGHTTDSMVTEAIQSMITTRVRAIVAAELQAAGLTDLEAAPDDDAPRRELRRSTYGRLVTALIAAGLWPIPAQSWAGVGIPAFDGYNEAGNYARFAYRGPHGEDLSAQAFHILTPYIFQTGLAANRVSTTGTPFQPGIDSFSAIFSYWRDQFDFDFVRYDSVDHIFDSLIDGDWTKPAADRPSPAVLHTCVERSRSNGKPYIGNFAERMGLEVEEYAHIGFDLILGTDMLRPIDRSLIEDSFRLAARLEAVNRGRATRFAVPFCVDTHDTGNPGLLGAPLVQRAGPQRMRLRHFVSRFLSVAAARRPKYEVMGSQDLSYGLYEANIREVNLTWVGDLAYNASYHQLEDVYDQLREQLIDVKGVRWQAGDWWAWWVHVLSDQTLLVAVLTLESDAPQGGTVTIDLNSLLSHTATQIVEYALTNEALTPAQINHERLTVTLEPLMCRLMHIRTLAN
jgi:hypothetical protein